MQRGQTVQPDDAIELAAHLLDPRFAPDVVTRFKNVRGIETNTESFRLAHILDNSGHMLEPMAQA